RKGHEERVAVRRRAHDRFGADIAVGARPVVDDERLAEPPRQPLTDQACDSVGRPASGKADNDAHWARRIALRPRDAWQTRQRGSAGGQMQEFTAGKFHFEPPFTSFDHLVGAGEQSRWHVEIDYLCHPPVDDQLEPTWKNDRHVGGPLSFQDFPGVDSSLMIGVRAARALAHQSASLDELALEVACRDGVPYCQCYDPIHSLIKGYR